MKNKSQNQRERLENVLSTPHQYFSTKMQNHLNNKIGYLSKLPYVSIPVHIELLFIAKKRPDTFLNNDIIKFLTNIVDDRRKEMPKALATTLFMIFGQVYRNQPKPPLIMAKLLFRDVTDAQEFCHFEKAAEFIHRVQLTYFFQPSLLNLETRLALYHQSKPAAEEVPDSYFQWDAELGYEISRVQKEVNSEIESIQRHSADDHYADVLVFFMTMPEGQDTFISKFDYLCSTYPEYIPNMFNSVLFFLIHANASDTFASEFAKQFAQLNPTICVDEYNDTLTKIINSNQQYFPVISGAKLSMNFQKDDLNASKNPGISAIKSESSILAPVLPQAPAVSISYPGTNPANLGPSTFLNTSASSRNVTDTTVKYIIQAVFEASDEGFPEILRKLEEQFRNPKPPLNYTCEVLSKFLEQIPLEKVTIDCVNRIILTFDIFFKCTNFQSVIQQPLKKQQTQPQLQTPQICELISLFVAKISKTKFLVSISKNLTNIIVPPALKNEGLPFKQEALVPFTTSADLHQIAFVMIYAAAKYQTKRNPVFPVALGPPSPTISKSICAFCESPYFTVAAKAFALACLLIAISPNEIGASIYQYDEKLRKMFIRLFLLEFIGRTNDPDKLLEDIKFDETINDKKDMKKFISNLANLKYLSTDPLLHCRAPNYLDDLLTNEEKFSTTPKYLTSRITKEMIESISYIGLTKYIFASLISIAKSRNNLTASEIYRQEKVYEWVELLIQKHFTAQERHNMLVYYAKYLENKERSIRLSAYVIILILNADIQRGDTNRNSDNISISFDSSSEIGSRENSSISIQPVASVTTATTVCVPISTVSVNSNISSLVGSFIIFKFDLPDSEETVGIISRSLDIDNEVEIAKAFVIFLAYSQFSGNALAEFVEKRPLLANCLQEPCLSNLLKFKYSYDNSYKPNFNYPNFRSALSLNSQKTQRSEYHDAFAIHPKLIDLSQLPTVDSPTVVDSKFIIENILNESKNENEHLNDSEDFDESKSNSIDFIDKFECDSKNNENDNNDNLNPFESSQLEREVYRFEIILYFSREESLKTSFYEDYTQWFALASLKRYVLNYNEAFLLYAKPTLNILHSELKHANFLTKIMINRFISLLSICYLKLIHQRNILNEKEQDFLHQELIPKLEEISKFETMEQDNDLPQIVPALLNGIIGSFKTSSVSSKNSNQRNEVPTSKKIINNNSISSFVLPNGIPFEMIVNSNEMMIGIQLSLIITTDEYASKWLLNAAVQSPALIIQNKNNFQKNVIIPLILSSNKDAVVDFFRLMIEQFPEETQNLMDSIAKIVNSVYESEVNPKISKK